MISKTNFLVCFLVQMFLFGRYGESYKFTSVEYIHQFVSTDEHAESMPNSESAPLEGKGAEICLSAKEYAALDVTDPAEDGSIKFVWNHSGLIWHTSKYAEDKEGFIWCKTAPEIWLRTDENLHNQYVIMIEDPGELKAHAPYKFDTETMHLMPKLCSIEDPEYKELIARDNSLQAGIGARAWWYICEEAKNRVESTKNIKMEMKRKRKIKRQLLEFTAHNGIDKEKHVTLMCPTTPVMVTYFGASKFDVKIKVVVKA